MADLQNTNVHGIIVPEGDNRTNDFYNPNLQSIETMKTALQDFDSDLYTDKKLNTMTYNDLVYAIRVNEITEVPA